MSAAHQDEQEIVVELLRLAGASGGLRELIRATAGLVKSWSGCDAVGIRLRDGEDYPYFETRGFPEEFVRGENSLCGRDENGEIKREADGSAALECMCGNVIRGRVDRSMPFISEAGSFWSNGTTRLLTTTTDEDRGAKTRNRCNGDGYESVAVIPLSAEGETFGLLQINDKRPDRFTERDIRLFERLASALALVPSRRGAADALEASLAELEAVHASVPVAMILMDADRRVWKCNRAAAEMTRRNGEMAGLTAGQALRCAHSVRPDGRRPSACDACAIHKALCETQATGAAIGQFEADFDMLDGERIRRKRLLVSTASLLVAGEAHVLLCLLDASEVKRAEEQLGLQALALEQIQDGVVMLDMDGRITFANDAICRLAGCSVERILHADAHLLGGRFAGETSHDEIIEATIRDGQWRGELTCSAADGTATIDCRTRLVRDAAGRPVGICGVGTNVSDRRRAGEEKFALQAQLMQAQKMAAVGRLAAGVAHDFNNQLVVILGYCDMLACTLDEGDPRRDLLDEIARAGERANATTSHLLSFSRRQLLRPEPTDLGQVLAEMRSPVATMVGEDIAFSVEAQPGCRPVLVDRAGLQQSLMNLVVNARDAMPGGGRLMVAARDFDVDSQGAGDFPDAPVGRYVLVEVRDSGAGMDAETLAMAFDPFFTTKQVGKGTGLGLPMVLGFVQQSRGFVRMESEPGRGTTARILLPATPQAAGDRAEPAAAPAGEAEGRETIAVVEDEESVRRLIVRILTGAGYAVLEAATPSEALALVAAHTGEIDLLVSDVVMPEMNGVDLARELVRLGGPARALFVTGYADEEARNDLTDVLAKPFEAAELLRRVRAALGAGPARD